MKFPITLLLLLLPFTALQAQEKAHLHFDKQHYLPGDTVFFKAYLFYKGLPSFLSTNFYVAAYADDGSLFAQKQYPVFDGTCNGDIALPDTLQGQGIRIRVFTRGLSAEDSTSFYEQRLELIQQQKQLLRQYPSYTSQVQFFAEGRHVLAGFQNSFAVIAKDEQDNPLMLNGCIRESAGGDTVTVFQTSSNGLGAFSFMVEQGKTYTAWFKDPLSGKQRSVVLPETEYYGALLHMEQSGNYMYCNIYKRIENGLYNNLELAAYNNRQQVYGISALLNGNNQWVCKIPLDSLPAGQLKFILTDTAGRELASRMIFNNLPPADPEIVILKKDLQPRGENLLEIKTNAKVFYNLSVSVTDAELADSEQATTIREAIGLNKKQQRLAGTGRSLLGTEAAADLDAFMIVTNAPAATSFHSAYTKSLDNFLAVKAGYNDKYAALPENNQLTLIMADTVYGRRFYKLPLLTANSFGAEGLVFFDSSRCSFQLDLDKAKTENVRLERVGAFIPAETIEPLTYASPDTVINGVHTNLTIADDLYKRFVVDRPGAVGEFKLLKPVVVRAWKRNPEQLRMEELDREYTTGMFSGLTRGYQFNLLDDKNASAYSDIYSYLMYRFNGLIICPDLTTGRRTLRYKAGNSLGSEIPPCKDPSTLVLFFLNEMEMPDPEDAERIDLSQVAYIKLINGVVINSSFTHYGVVVYVYLRKGNEIVPGSIIPMRKQKLKGYDIPQNFTVPDYSNNANRSFSDKRTTLFWEPYLILNREHNSVQLRFNNNDVSKKLLVTIEGFDEEGKLVHIEQLIE